MPLDEVAVLSLAHPALSCSHAVLSGLARRGGITLVCDERHLPVGMMLPLVTHSTQAERLARQAAATLPLKKRLWQSIVKAKICAQAQNLETLTGDDAGLRKMAAGVRSGDTENREARAARRYWPLFFDNPDFRRNPELPGINGVLNYGYAVLRAITARAICAAGLHPTLGLHHHNRYDPYCLADDLMEPFRPMVDEAALFIAREYGMEVEMQKEVKRLILEPLLGTLDFHGEDRTLFDVLSRAASSLAQVFMGQRKGIILPQF